MATTALAARTRATVLQEINEFLRGSDKMRMEAARRIKYLHDNGVPLTDVHAYCQRRYVLRHLYSLLYVACAEEAGIFDDEDIMRMGITRAIAIAEESRKRRVPAKIVKAAHTFSADEFKAKVRGHTFARQMNFIFSDEKSAENVDTAVRKVMETMGITTRAEALAYIALKYLSPNSRARSIKAFVGMNA